MNTTPTVIWITDERIFAAAVEFRATATVKLNQQAFACADSLYQDFDVGPLAEAIVNLTGQLDTPVQTITLVIPLNWCFHHVLEYATKKVSETAVAFDVEPFLPVPLESLTLVHGVFDHSTLVIGVPTEPMKLLLEELARQGLQVEKLLVDAVIGASMEEPNSAGTIQDKRWRRWADLDARPPSLGVCEANQLGDGASERGCIIDLATIQNSDANDVAMSDLSPAHAGISNLLRAVAQSRTEFNLATGALAPKGRLEPLHRLVRHCLVLLIVLGGLLLGVVSYQRNQIASHQAGVQQNQLKVYQEVFSGSRLPPGAAMRLASERIRLEGLTRTAPGHFQEAPPFNLLDQFREVVAALPADVRIKLVDLRFDETQLSIRGQTTEHRDAERIVEAINRLPDLEARPPRSTRMSAGGVEFTVTTMGEGSHVSQP